MYYIMLYVLYYVLCLMFNSINKFQFYKCVKNEVYSLLKNIYIPDIIVNIPKPLRNISLFKSKA